MVWMLDQKKNGKELLQYVKRKEEWGFDEFVENRNIYKKKHREVPNWATIKATGDPYRKRRESTAPEGNKSDPLTLSEFVRLVVQLRDHSDSRKALLDSRRSRTRPQLDGRVRKDSCWNDVIADKFNEVDYAPFLDLSSTMRNVDTRKPPSSPKVGKDLMDAFIKTKKTFSVWYQKWHRSGHRDPEDFESFQDPDLNDTSNPLAAEIQDDVNRSTPSASQFKNFLPRSGGPKVVDDGQRAHVVFIALRCGTPQVDRELLSLFHRAMSSGKGPIHFESGLPGIDQHNEEDLKEYRRRKKRRKKARRRSKEHSSDSGYGENLKEVKKSLNRLTDNHIKVLESQSSLANTTQMHGGHIGQRVMERDEKFKRSQQTQALLRSMAEVEDMMEKQAAGTSLHDMAREQFEFLKGQFNSLIKDDP